MLEPVKENAKGKYGSCTDVDQSFEALRTLADISVCPELLQTPHIFSTNLLSRSGKPFQNPTLNIDRDKERKS